jgi:hypothetical protein
MLLCGKDNLNFSISHKENDLFLSSVRNAQNTNSEIITKETRKHQEIKPAPLPLHALPF